MMGTSRMHQLDLYTKDGIMIGLGGQEDGNCDGEGRSEVLEVHVRLSLGSGRRWGQKMGFLTKIEFAITRSWLV